MPHKQVEMGRTWLFTCGVQPRYQSEVVASSVRRTTPGNSSAFAAWRLASVGHRRGILFLLAESLMVFFFFQDGGTKKKTASQLRHGMRLFCAKVSIARRVKELAPKAFVPSTEVEMAAVN